MPRAGTPDLHTHTNTMRKCEDCAALIPAFGNKLRCAACGDARSVTMQRERDRARRVMRLAKKQMKKGRMK